jgi:hypothetical protein
MTGTKSAPIITKDALPPKEPVHPQIPPHPPDRASLKPGTVQTERKIYRPKLLSKYVEPDLGPDLLEGMELLYESHGKAIQHKKSLPPRTDVIEFDPARHQAEFDKNIKWHSCPLEHRVRITDIIKRHWDVFAEEGLKNNIRGFVCRIETGDIAPVCCKPPRYGPHESETMIKLCHHLQDNNLIEDDDGPWGAIIVLAAKPNQEEIPWHQYTWRLCVSYRRLNQVVRPFTFPIPRCDDAVADIPPWAKVFLSFDLDCGYWQVAMDPASRSKTAFFNPKWQKAMDSDADGLS